MFSFLSELYLWSIPLRFLGSFLVEINRTYNKVSSRRNGGVAQKRIAVGKVARAILPQRARIAKRNIRDSVNWILSDRSSCCCRLPLFRKSTGSERHFYGCSALECRRVFIRNLCLLFFSILFASLVSGLAFELSLLDRNANRDWRTAVAYAANR